jgi:hypothetical protein
MIETAKGPRIENNKIISLKYEKETNKTKVVKQILTVFFRNKQSKKKQSKSISFNDNEKQATSLIMWIFKLLGSEFFPQKEQTTGFSYNIGKVDLLNNFKKMLSSDNKPKNGDVFTSSDNKPKNGDVFTSSDNKPKNGDVFTSEDTTITFQEVTKRFS